MLGVDAKGDDNAERHSEFVTQILNAIKDAGLPPPPIKFADSIEINVSKKPGARQVVILSAVPNQDLPNSSFIKGKGAHQITYQ
jgi:hypothetical protein